MTTTSTRLADLARRAFAAPRLPYTLVWLLCAVSGLLLYGPHQMDELGQITAFALHKLGILGARELPWEFDVQMRPWLQPAFYALVMSPFVDAPLSGAPGHYHHPSMERLLILCQLPLVTAALVAFAATERRLAGRLPALDRAATRHLHLLVFSLAGWFFLPSMLMRHSSEAWSAAWLVLGLAAFFVATEATGGRRVLWAGLAGLVFGLAFWSRFQVGLFIAGFWLWWLGDALVAGLRGHRRGAVQGPAATRGAGAASSDAVPATAVPVSLGATFSLLGAVALGIVATFAVGVPIDAWGYGEWVLTPWRYAYENLVLGKVAAFGNEPWWYLLREVLERTLNPFTWLWLGVAVWLGRGDPRRRALTAGVVLFVLIHSLITHKEGRFLLPVVGPTLWLLVAGMRQIAAGALATTSPLGRRAAWLFHPRLLMFLGVVGSLVTVGYTATSLVKDRHRIERTLWSLPAGTRVFADNNFFARYDRLYAGDPEPPVDFEKTFLKPPHISYERVRNGERAAACAESPEALVLLTTGGFPQGGNPVDIPQASVLSYPPDIAWRLFAGQAWFGRLWRFRLVRCPELRLTPPPA